MIAESVRIVAAWLADATHGVNALLASVPKDGADAVPASVTLYNEVTHPEIARGQVPDTLPALIVTVSPSPVTATSSSVQPFPGDVRVEVEIRHAVKTAGAFDTDDAVVGTGIVFRAVRASLRRLITVGEVSRVRNQVQLLAWGDDRLMLYTPNTDNHVTGTLTITLTMRDVWAGGA